MWSVMILFQKGPLFLKECIESVLAQELPEEDVQIVLIAEGEMDTQVKEMVSLAGRGRVEICEAAGAGEAVDVLNLAVKKAEGKFIHFLCSCDRVRPGFYLAMDKLLWQYSEAGAAFFCSSYIDAGGAVICDGLPEMDRKGILPDWLPQIAERNIIPLSAMVVKREVFRKHGGFYGSTFGAVWEMWTRVAKYYPIAYAPEIGVECREDHSSLSSPDNSRESMEDLLLAMEFIGNQLPTKAQSGIMKRAKKFYTKNRSGKTKLLREKAHVAGFINLYRKGAPDIKGRGGMFLRKLFGFILR